MANLLKIVKALWNTHCIQRLKCTGLQSFNSSKLTYFLFYENHCTNNFLLQAANPDIRHLSSVPTSCLSWRGVQERECALVWDSFSHTVLIPPDSHGLDVFKLNGRTMAMAAVTSVIALAYINMYTHIHTLNMHKLSTYLCALTSDTTSPLLPPCQQGKSIHFRKMPCESERLQTRTEVSVYMETER